MSGLAVDLMSVVGGSFALALLLKSTFVLLVGGAAVQVARRTRASTRHLLVACTFGALLLLLPLVLWAPPLTIHVSAPRLIERAVVATTMESSTATTLMAGADDISTDSSRRFMSLAPAAVVVVWMSGVLVVLAGMVANAMRVDRLRRTGLPWSPDNYPGAARLVQSVGRRSPVVLTHEAVSSPMACRLFNPTILLPADAAAWNAADLRRALIHELEHIRRGDLFVHAAARATCALYWFHPLVWLTWRRLVIEAERACDDAVLRHSDSAEYAEQLVTLARTLLASTVQPGLAMANRSDLAIRIRAILDQTQQRGRLRAATASLGIAGMTVVTLAMAPMSAVPIARASEQLSLQSAAPCNDQRLQKSLLRAASRDQIDRLTTLVSGGAGVDCPIPGDGTALIAAAKNGHLRAARFLLDHGADPNLAVEGDGNPLIAASAQGHLVVVQLLLERGARVNDVVPGDETSLIQASAAGHLAVARFLVAHNADVNARVWIAPTPWLPAGEWRTPLGMAQKGGHALVAAFLASVGGRE